MSEEKKNIELNDEDLEKVNGGFDTKPVTVTSYSFVAGDCFAWDSRRVRVLNSYNNVYSNQSIIVELSDNYSNFEQVSMPVNDHIFSKEFFVGNNKF